MRPPNVSQRGDLLQVSESRPRWDTLWSGLTSWLEEHLLSHLFPLRNQILNAGFESGSLFPGWQVVPGSPTFDGAVVNSIAHHGQYSLELGDVDWVEQRFDPPIGAPPFVRNWALSFWCQGGRGTYGVKVEYADGTSSFSDVPYHADWQTFRLPLDRSKLVKRVEFSAWELIEHPHIDDVKLFGVKSSKP